MDQLAKGTLWQFFTVQQLINFYIQQEGYIKWDVSLHGRELYQLKPTLGSRNKFQYLTRAQEVVITWLRLGLSRPKGSLSYHEDRSQIALTIENVHLECTVL